MLDACPHHHEDETVDAAAAHSLALESAAAVELDGVTLRSPRTSKPAGIKPVWRSLNEFAGTKAFEDLVHREFPHAAGEWTDEPSRRHFLKLMSASLALAGVSTACTLRKTEEKVVPYVNPPEQVVPGRPLFYASTAPWCGYGKGVIVESHEGRPTNVQGNADHLKALTGFPGDKADPTILGSSDIWLQASILDMYDPDRSQTVLRGDENSSWGVFIGDTGKVFADKSKRVRFLTGTTTSPTVARLMTQFLSQSPNARWHQYDPMGRSNARAGAERAFGEDVQSVYRFDLADVILSLDSNFLMDLPGSLIYARQFIAGRRIRQGPGEAKMNRLYVAESGVTPTGAKADHRVAVRSGDIEAIARGIAAAVNGTPATGKRAHWINAVADDLKANAGRCLVIAGECQPPAVHALVHALNDALGNVGKTVSYVPTVEAAGPTGPASLAELMHDVRAGLVDVLVMMGVNPAFTAPVEYNLRKGVVEPTPGEQNAAFYDQQDGNPLAKVPLVIHHGLYGPRHDETAALARWHVPASHYLECWGDLRAYDGTASLVQPLIDPLYTTKSEIELLAFIAGVGDVKPYDLVRQTWSEAKANGGEAFDTFWAKSLEKGAIPGTAAAEKKVVAKVKLADALASGAAAPAAGEGLELVFRPDPHILDGRFGNNGWLQELPKPVSLVTWENVAFLSVTTAAELSIAQSDQGKGTEVPRVQIDVGDKSITLPAVIMPGVADHSITVYLGYGRLRAGHVATGLGADAYAIRPAADTWFLRTDRVEVLHNDRASVATTQTHHLIDLPTSEAGQLDAFWLEDRQLVRTKTLKELGEWPKTNDEGEAIAPPPPGSPKRKISLPVHVSSWPSDQTLLKPYDYDHGDPARGILTDPHFNKWGMVIDNQACIGCNACVIACQSENNIAIVGKEQILRGRDMHWLRIDTYFEGRPENAEEAAPTVYFQPIPCMHCENAPCTLVCPVEATTISTEGVNEMTYNRCVGTRYCSNNCPYKVRRFNFLEYSDYDTPQFMLQRNPNVTVRARGVMEKCNYCVQRISQGRIEAKRYDRPINPGEVVTACAQACPTQAITFGNLNDNRWEVTKLQTEPLRYTLLDDLNTQPRTSYLARVKNPNPALEKAGQAQNAAEKA